MQHRDVRENLPDSLPNLQPEEEIFRSERILMCCRKMLGEIVERPFPAPVLSTHHPWNASRMQAEGLCDVYAYLARHHEQMTELEQRILPLVLQRETRRSDQTVHIASIGCATGEELTDIFTAVAGAIQRHGTPDCRAHVEGIEKEKDVALEAVERLSGRSPFVVSSYGVETLQQEYAAWCARVMSTLSSHRAIAAQSLYIRHANALDPVVMESLRTADVVLLNSLLSFAKLPHETDLTRGVSEHAKEAFILHAQFSLDPADHYPFPSHHMLERDPPMPQMRYRVGVPAWAKDSFN